MAARFLVARRKGMASVRFVIWLDVTQTEPDGSPSPLWLREYVFHRRAAEPFQAFKDRVKEEARRLALEELARMAPQAEDTLPDEGEEFS